MKVLFVLDLYFPHVGGVEILFENIISRFSDAGIESIILTSHYDKDLKKHEKIGENIEIYRVGHNRYDFMFWALFLGYKLAKDVEIIHTTTYNSAIPASILGKISGKKVILTVHEIFGKLWYNFVGWKGFFFKLFESLIFKFRFESYICVSNYTKNSLRTHFGIPDNKLITVYNAIDYDFWNRENVSLEEIENVRENIFPQGKYIGLFYGRSGISKGLEFYIKSIPNILKSIPNFHAFLILPQSKNNPISYIKNLIEKLNISDFVTIYPSVTNTQLREYILASDVVIIPSLAEGFGFAVAEVSALEQKLVTTNISAIPEVASGNVIFVEPQNPSQIAQAVIDFSEDNFHCITKKYFPWEKTLNLLQDIYKKNIGK